MTDRRNPAGTPERVLLVTEHSLRGGAETSTQLLAHALTDAGSHVEVAFGWRGEMLTESVAQGIKVPFGTGPRVPGRARLRVPGMLAAAALGRFDIVHLSALEHRSTLTGLAAIRTGHTTIGHLRSPWQIAHAQRLHDLGASLITNSTATRDELTASGRERVSFVPNGIDPSEFESTSAATTPDTRAERLASIGVPAEATVALCVANMAPYKAIDDLVRGVAMAMDVNPNLHLVHIGDAHFPSTQPVRERIQAEIARSGHAHRFHLLGRRADIAELTAAADLILVPSRGEGTARAILEGWSARRPVVAANADGLVDLVDDGRNGRLMDLADPAATATAILSIADDVDGARSLVEAGYLDVTTRYTHGAHVQAVLAVYAAALAERPSRS